MRLGCKFCDKMLGIIELCRELYSCLTICGIIELCRELYSCLKAEWVVSWCRTLNDTATVLDKGGWIF